MQSKKDVIKVLPYINMVCIICGIYYKGILAHENRKADGRNGKSNVSICIWSGDWDK